MCPTILVGCKAQQKDNTCNYNHDLIVNAVAVYYLANGEFPPRAIVDKNDMPAHSWRVLIAPYVDFHYKPALEYDMHSNWNSHNNSKLASLTPPYYICSAGHKNNMYFIMLQSPNSDATHNHNRLHAHLSRRELDAISNYVIIAETPVSDHIWIRPTDDCNANCVENIASGIRKLIANTSLTSGILSFRSNGQLVKRIDLETVKDNR